MGGVAIYCHWWFLDNCLEQYCDLYVHGDYKS